MQWALPLAGEPILINTLDAQVNGSSIMIGSSAFDTESAPFKVTASITTRVAVGTDESKNERVFLIINLQRLRKGGSTWETIAGARSVLLTPGKLRFAHTSLLPTMTVMLYKGDQIRLVINRSKGEKGGLQGANLIEGSILGTPDHGTSAFTIFLSKL
ncbi:hypothetical protein K5I29_05595 [Flavobacterium agricola]|uniref:Uncharacterized protein n=1 Tax=Flavobacterium agricola TaxID=2870839 RepID=A0ABY6M475_9FLAO|nr:hypothetical protein [Flavobacterium agricola]UYW02368.1 hypothetical protein K5I29_05595 [Flavobacterium agricola]